MSCSKLASHPVLPATFQPSSPPALFPCAPLESITRPWPVQLLCAFHLPPGITAEQHMPAPLLLASLAATLDTFPILCASLQENGKREAAMRLDNSNAVVLVEAVHSSPLSSCIPTPNNRYDTANAAGGWDCSLIPNDVRTPVNNDWTGTACAVQVTRWACGGVLLGLSAFHCLMDAQSAATFMREWGRQCAALKAGLTAAAVPSEQPVFDRAFMLDGMREAFSKQPSHDHIVYRICDTAQPPMPPPGWTPPHVVSRVYHFPRAELDAIRRSATAPNSEVSLSVYDALYAHLIAVLGAAAGALGEDEVLVSQLLNGRKLLGEPHFFGSVGFWLQHRTTPAAIQSDLPATAAAIHHSHSSQDRTTLLAYNGFMASAPSMAHIQLGLRVFTHDFHVSSWRNQGMYDVDFGSGTADMAGPGPQPVPRLMFFAEGARGSVGEGGIDVWLSLEDEQWERMMQQGQLHKYAAAA